MINLKTSLSAITASLCLAAPLASDICHHCDEIRLWNAENHKDYEYFDDYLKDGAPEDDSPFAKKTAPAQNDKPVAERNVPKKGS